MKDLLSITALKKYCLFVGLTLVVNSTLVLADVTGVKMGFAAWNHEPKGTIRYQGTDTNAETGFQLTDKSEGFFWVAIEHPIPGLPNIKLSYTKLSNSGSGVLSNSISFGGNTFNANENISSELNLDQTDLTFYYELSDTAIHFDLGLTLKYLDGNARITSLTTTQTRQTKFEGVLPLIYASLEFKTPISGLSAGVNVNAISYSGNSYSDVQVNVTYVSKAKVGVMAGYRRMQLKLDDLDSVYSDLRFSGPFLSVYFHF